MMCFRRVFCCGKTETPSRNVFDKKGFCDTMHDVGKAYRYRAIALIKICQSFLVASEQRLDQYTELLSVTTECDEAIRLAIESRGGKEKSQEADLKFDDAVRRLSDYEFRFHIRLHSSTDSVERKMEAAKGMDERNMHKSRNEERDDRLIVVEFHILSTLACKDPTVVRQVLSNPDQSALPEILWNFSHFKDEQRLTLAKNPHFYAILPPSSGQDARVFSCDPAENYRGTIYVLTNNTRQLFLEVGPNPRGFDHVSNTNNILILRDITGKLKSEEIVRNSIRVPPPYSYRIQPTQVQPQEAQSWQEIRDQLEG